MTTLYANPYDLSATGFYFESLEEYDTKSKSNRNEYGQPVEEYEIQFVDGDNPLLFDVCSIDQCTLSLWFDEIELLDESEQVELYYKCAWLGQTAQEALDNLNDDGYITESSVVAYVQDLADNTGMLDSLPEELRFYFDYEKFAQDMVLNGEITEFEFSGNTYTASGF